MLLYTYVQRPLEDPAHPNAVDLPSPRAPLSLAGVLALLPPHDRARVAHGHGAFLRARVADPNFGYIWCAPLGVRGGGGLTHNAGRILATRPPRCPPWATT